MPNVSLELLVQAMTEKLGGDENRAHQLIAGALDALALPTVPVYTPEQAMQIGLVISHASARLLSESGDAYAAETGPLLEQWVSLAARAAAELKAKG